MSPQVSSIIPANQRPASNQEAVDVRLLDQLSTWGGKEEVSQDWDNLGTEYKAIFKVLMEAELPRRQEGRGVLASRLGSKRQVDSGGQSRY